MAFSLCDVMVKAFFKWQVWSEGEGDGEKTMLISLWHWQEPVWAL